MVGQKAGKHFILNFMIKLCKIFIFGEETGVGLGLVGVINI